MSEMTDELSPDPITGKLNMKTVPMHLSDRMEQAAVRAYEECVADGVPLSASIAAAVRAAIVVAPNVDVAELSIAPPGSVIATKEWVDETQKVLDRCKLDPLGTPEARAAMLELRNRVEKIIPAVPPKDWRGATAK